MTDLIDQIHADMGVKNEPLQIVWSSGMAMRLDGTIRRYTFKRAKQLEPGDTIRVQQDGKWTSGTVFNVGQTFDERGKPVKVQHMGTGNVQKGVFIIFDDGGEALAHPDEQIEVARR